MSETAVPGGCVWGLMNLVTVPLYLSLDKQDKLLYNCEQD